MKDIILKILSLLIPPIDANPEHVMAYRSAISAVVAALVASTFFLWARVAWARDLEEFRTVVTARQDVGDRAVRKIEFMIVRNDLKDRVWNACMAIQNGNQDALDAANREIDQLEEEYFRLENRVYVREPCDVVLIAEHKR